MTLFNNFRKKILTSVLKVPLIMYSFKERKILKSALKILLSF